MKIPCTALILFIVPLVANAQNRKQPELFDVPEIRSSWDDLTEGIETSEDWRKRRVVLRQRYLDLIRDQHKPQKPPLDLKVHEDVVVDDVYRRRLISYAVESDERAHAYLGIPLDIQTPAPAIVALHGTYKYGKKRVAGLIDNPDKAYLDHLCRRGYVVIAPEHFVSGHRIPAEGPYETGAFHKKHPEWTAVGKFTYEHSIAIDVLQSLDEVDDDRIGALGHDLPRCVRRSHQGIRVQVRCVVLPAQPTRRGLVPRPLVCLLQADPRCAAQQRNAADRLSRDHGVDRTSGISRSVRTQRQRLLMLMKVMDVYELERSPQNFGFYVHGRGHSVAHESRQLIYGFMDSHLKPPAATRTRLVRTEE